MRVAGSGQQARDSDRNKPAEYRTIAMQLRELFHNPTKKTLTTARGSTFAADFAGESENLSDEAGRKGTGRPGGRKRTGTTSIERESSLPKKPKNQKCLACNIKGHSLPDCWTLFEDKRPEGYIPTVSLRKPKPPPHVPITLR